MILFSPELKQQLKPDYQKLKPVVQELAEYLRQRSYVDGVQTFMDYPTQYKHWSFLYFIVYSMRYSVSNYFGVVYDDHGMKGDTLFPDFFAHYTSKPRGYWRYNSKDLLLMRRYFREVYREKLGRFVMKEDKDFYNNMLKLHQISLWKEVKERKEARENNEEYEEKDIFDEMKDVMFKHRQKQIKEHFEYLKESKTKEDKDRVREIDRDHSKVMQSESALRAMLDPRNLMNDRFSFQSSEGGRNGKSMSCNSSLFVWDHVLRKEHWYIKVISNDMDHDISIWNGVDKLKKDINDWELKTYIKKPVPAPIVDNYFEDKYYHAKVIDMSGGGWINDGTDGSYSEASSNRDTIQAILCGGEFVITNRAVASIGRGSTMLGSKILWSLMRQKEYEAVLYDRKSI